MFGSTLLFLCSLNCPLTFDLPLPLPRDGIEAMRLSVDEMKGKLPNESVGTMGSRVVSDAWIWMGCTLCTLVVCCCISIGNKLKVWRPPCCAVQSMVENESAMHTVAVICCHVHFTDAHSAGLACNNWIRPPFIIHMIPFVFSPTELLHGTGKGKQVCIVKYVCKINEPQLSKRPRCYPLRRTLFRQIPPF